MSYGDLTTTAEGTQLHQGMNAILAPPSIGNLLRSWEIDYRDVARKLGDAMLPHVLI
jgi:hypothetical protein